MRAAEVPYRVLALRLRSTRTRTRSTLPARRGARLPERTTFRAPHEMPPLKRPASSRTSAASRSIPSARRGGGARGVFLAMDPPEHTRSGRRRARLTPRRPRSSRASAIVAHRRAGDAGRFDASRLRGQAADGRISDAGVPEADRAQLRTQADLLHRARATSTCRRRASPRSSRSELSDHPRRWRPGTIARAARPRRRRLRRATRPARSAT
jgi:hypothetical protein